MIRTLPLPQVAPLALLALLSACGNEYRCPTPIGKIVRDNCDSYKTKYESLKVELGFSIAGISVGVKAGKEKLRDPSELLQVLMLETMALCKDYNACRMPSTDYRRRREEADHKFTAVVAIGQQLKGDLDKESKRKLLEKLMEVITSRSRPQPKAQSTRRASSRVGLWRRPIAYHPGMFRKATSPWFGSKYMPARPKLASGLPVLASWWIGHGGQSTFINFKFWGKTEADDRIYVSFTDPVKDYDAAVRPTRNKLQGSVRISERTMKIGSKGAMTLDYKLGATGKKHRIGTFRLAPELWLKRGYMAYNADPIRKDPVEYERPWIIFYSKVRKQPRVTMRCKHRGKKLDTVISGQSRTNPYRASKLSIHAVPLPIRIGLKGGQERTTWKKSMPGEKPLTDMLAKEAAGKWRCVAKINARKARVFSFELRADGSVVPQRKPDDGAWPWWPVATKRVPNRVEEQAEKAE
ncbi:MAG: hypothetical protein JRH20_22380 [Deltaproteobacteria bacterium]|nr:hypothetical protein [Deltaproteobacteria bacterium]